MSKQGRPVKSTEWRNTDQQILGAARKLFFEKGFHATTMVEIARESGYTRTALYLHFSSKLDILKALMVKLPIPFAGLENAINAPCLETSLRTWVLSVLDVYRANRDLLLAVNEARNRDPSFDEFFIRQTDRVSSKLAPAHLERILPKNIAEHQRKIWMSFLFAQLDWFCMRSVVQNSWVGPVEDGIDVLVQLWLSQSHNKG